MVENSDWATIVAEKALKRTGIIKPYRLQELSPNENRMLTIGGYQKKAVKLFMEEFRKSI
jgi:LysR family cyn operon transcriptional activator